MVSNVRSVMVRPATEGEREANRKSLLTQVVEGVWTRVRGVMNFVSLVRSRDMSAVLSNARGQDPFFSETSMYAVRKMTVFGRELVLPYLMELYVTDHPQVIKAMLVPPRQSEAGPFFLHDNGSSFGTFVNELFYKDGNTSENFILTCSAERSKELRAFMHGYLKEAVIGRRREEIKAIAQETVKEWAAIDGKLNARALAKLYINKVLTSLFFGGGAHEQIQKAIDTFSKYLMGKMLGESPTEKEVKEALEIFSTAIEEAIARGGEHNVAYDMKASGKFSDEDIKLMVWTFYFGAVDNSSESLTWALLMLAQHQNVQNALRDDFDAKIGSFLAECLRTFPPVHGVGRMINIQRGAVVEIELEDGQKIERYLEGGKLIAMRIQDAARRADLFGADVQQFNPERAAFGDRFNGHLVAPFLPFGSGAHSCPGWKLAIDEMAELFRFLLQECRVTTEHVGLPEIKGTALNKIQGEVFVSLEKR